MFNRKRTCFVVIVLLLLSSACTRLPGPAPLEEGDITIERLAESNSIPATWGNLVSVSHRPDFEHIFQLWFQDDDGNIRMIPYNMNSSRLLQNALYIPRK